MQVRAPPGPVRALPCCRGKGPVGRVAAGGDSGPSVVQISWKHPSHFRYQHEALKGTERLTGVTDKTVPGAFSDPPQKPCAVKTLFIIDYHGLKSKR